MHFLNALNSLNDIHCNEDNQTRTIINCNVDICDNIKEFNIIVLPVQNEIFQIPPNENIKLHLPCSILDYFSVITVNTSTN